MAYATVSDIEARMTRELSADEAAVCEALLADAAVLINAFCISPNLEAAKTVSCRMVIRAIGSGDDGGFPIGTQSGSVSALGYSQSWSVPSSGTNGELYLSKVEKSMLGVGNRIGSYSPLEEIAK
jgi:hypothetical protein